MTIDVRLRLVEDKDLPIFFEQQRDPDAVRMAAFTHKDPADRRAFNAHWAKIRGDPRITIRTVLAGGRVVGNVAAFVDDVFGKQEVTYWIGKEFWGQGIATRALSRFLTEVTKRPIYGRAAKDNVASIRVMEKYGFRVTGEDRGFANARGSGRRGVAPLCVRRWPTARSVITPSPAIPTRRPMTRYASINVRTCWDASKARPISSRMSIVCNP